MAINQLIIFFVIERSQYLHTCTVFLFFGCYVKLDCYVTNPMTSEAILVFKLTPPPLVNWLTFSSCIVKVNETMWGRINLFAGGAYYAI